MNHGVRQPLVEMRNISTGFLITIGVVDPGNWATNIGKGMQSYSYGFLESCPSLKRCRHSSSSDMCP